MARLAAVVGAAVLAFSGGAMAGEITMVPQGAPTAFYRGSADDPKIDSLLEASGVEPIGDGKFVLVAHDKHEALFVAEAATGKIVGEPISCAAFPTGLQFGPKWEGMARDDRGNFYVIGSHAGKTEEEKVQKSYLLRFRLKTDGPTPTIDAKSVTRWKCSGSLAESLGKDVSDPLERAKLKVEGLTIRRRGDRTELVVGLREPTDRVRVFSAELTESAAPESDLTFKPLFRFDAGKREGVPLVLTSMEYVPSWKGFFVVTSTEDLTNVFHGNVLWFLSDDAIKAGDSQPVRVAEFEPAMKCEGLAELPGSTSEKVRLVLTYDNDALRTKIPSRIQTVVLTR
jgi:hypothetical protein